jgi:hypothetical protein
MISSFVLLGKWRIGPAAAEILANRPLMVPPKTFLFRPVGPYYPAVQRLIELACPHQSLTDPVVEARTWNLQHANQLCWPPFIR